MKFTVFKKLNQVFPVILLFVSILLLIYIGFWRFRLGIVRYFDSDEFLYLNWAYHLKIGYKPYVDFMLITTPFYILFNIPIFWIWQGTDPIIVGRIIAFIISIITSISLVWLFWEMRKSWLAIITALIFLVLPLPSDKFLEIRPDNLSMLLFLWGLIFQVKWMGKENKKYAFFSGLLYTLSFLTLQKSLPYIIISIGFIVWWKLTAVLHRIKINNSWKWFFSGLFLPLLGFLVWALFSGNPNLVIYSIIKLPIEHAGMYGNLNLRFFYFQPNNVYYGQWGWGLGIIANHFIWILAILTASGRLIWSLFNKSKLKLEELFLSCLCLTAVIIYFVSPIKFPQYLIPAAVFVPLYTADSVYLLWKLVEKRRNFTWFFFFLYFMIGWFLYRTFNYVHLPKFKWTNKLQLQKLQKIYDTIPKSEYVLDLDGGTIYYPYPYYVCCLPYEDFRHLISMSLPSLKQALIKTKTKYIYQGGYDSIRWLSPDDREFIYQNYISKDNGELWIIRK